MQPRWRPFMRRGFASGRARYPIPRRGAELHEAEGGGSERGSAVEDFTRKPKASGAEWRIGSPSIEEVWIRADQPKGTLGVLGSTPGQRPVGLSGPSQVPARAVDQAGQDVLLRAPCRREISALGKLSRGDYSLRSNETPPSPPVSRHRSTEKPAALCAENGRVEFSTASRFEGRAGQVDKICQIKQHVNGFTFQAKPNIVWAIRIITNATSVNTMNKDKNGEGVDITSAETKLLKFGRGTAIILSTGGVIFTVEHILNPPIPLFRVAMEVVCAAGGAGGALWFQSELHKLRRRATKPEGQAPTSTPSP